MTFSPSTNRADRQYCLVMEGVLILGIGNSMRRDDGVGHAIAQRCSEAVPPGCEVLMLDGEATRVIDAWRDRDLTIVVDAIVTGAAPGTIYDFDLDADMVGHPGLTRDASVSSHYAGIAEAIALGQALGRMPTSLRLIGIEPGDVGFGVALTHDVGLAIDSVVTLVLGVAQAAGTRSMTTD